MNAIYKQQRSIILLLFLNMYSHDVSTYARTASAMPKAWPKCKDSVIGCHIVLLQTCRNMFASYFSLSMNKRSHKFAITCTTLVRDDHDFPERVMCPR